MSKKLFRKSPEPCRKYQYMCPACGLYFQQLTKHHVLPRRHFGSGAVFIVYLCRSCHDTLEDMICKAESVRGRLPKADYFQLVSVLVGHPDWKTEHEH